MAYYKPGFFHCSLRQKRSCSANSSKLLIVLATLGSSTLDPPEVAQGILEIC